MQKSVKRLLALLGLVLAFSLIAASCGNDDEDGTPEPTAGSTEAPDTPETTATIEMIQGGEGRLQLVQDRDELICGSRGDSPGYGVVQDDGTYKGFDIDFCAVVAAAVLGDSTKFAVVPLSSAERFTALQSGEIDVLIRNTTWTATRDGAEGANFLFTTFFDGQALMVPASTGFTELEDLSEASICVVAGTTTELNLTAVFSARGIPFNPVVFDDTSTLRPAYEEGQCEAWTSDASQLAGWKFTIEQEGGGDQHIMAEVISKEPLGPVVADGDTEWAQVVNWAVMSTVQAWEFGLDSSNIESYDGEDPNILNFLGQADFNPGLGLPDDFAVQVVSQVGNYEEIYNRHPELVPLDGSVNDLWTNGGLMYVPPYR